MAELNPFVLTKNGQSLMAKILANNDVCSFTKIKLSSQAYTESQLENLINLFNIEKSIDISSIEIVNSTTVHIKGAVNNTDLEIGYAVNTIGLYALDPDVGEILYAVSRATSAGYMPPYNGTTSSGIMFDFMITVGNSDNVSITVNPAAVATQADVEEIYSNIGDFKKYAGYTFDDMYGVEVNYTTGAVTRLAGAVGKHPGTDFDEVECFKRYRCIVTDGGVEIAKYGDDAYTETGALTQTVNVNGVIYPTETPVQTMVCQPRFYYRVVPLSLENNEAKDEIIILPTTGATADGILTITLNGTDYEVQISETDNANYKISDKIVAVAFDGWTITETASGGVRFVCNKPGTTTGLTVDAGTTGVNTTVTQTVYGYIGKGFKARKIRYYVSPTKKEGFKIHPAFMQNGIEKSYIYLSAFEGSLYDTSAGIYILDDAQVADFAEDKLSSISGAKPISGKTQKLTRTNCRTLASNCGAGWSIQTISVLACSQLLYLIEYANLDSQGAVGAGITSGSNSGNNNAELTGSTSAITYRGEENLWGNIEKMIDGANVYCDVDKGLQEIFIADSGFADGSGSVSYTNADITMSSNRGYITAMAYSQKSDWLFIPAETVSSHTEATVKDRYNPKQKHDFYVPNESSDGFKVPLSGGNWFSGNSAGLFSLTTIKDETYNSNSLGARLVYVPTDTAGLMPTGTNTVKALENLPKSPMGGEVVCLTQESTVPIDKWGIVTEPGSFSHASPFHKDIAPAKYFDVDVTQTPTLNGLMTSCQVLRVLGHFEPDIETIIFYGVIPGVTDRCTLLIIRDLPAVYHTEYGDVLKLFYAQSGTLVEGVTPIEETGWYRGIDPEDPEDPTIIQPISEVPSELLDLIRLYGVYPVDTYSFFGEEDMVPNQEAATHEALANISCSIKLGLDNGLYQFKDGEWKDLTYKSYMLNMAKEGE